jgi:hypothetical protein
MEAKAYNCGAGVEMTFFQCCGSGSAQIGIILPDPNPGLTSFFDTEIL